MQGRGEVAPMAEDDLDYDTIVQLLEKADKEDKDDKERRKKRDWITIMPVILSIIAWSLVFAVWFILDQAAPPRDYGWLSFFGYYAPNEPWPRRPVNISYIMLIVSVILCVTAFFFNKMRMKRKGDKYRVSVFFVSAIALITLVVFLVRFIPTNIIGYW